MWTVCFFLNPILSYDLPLWLVVAAPNVAGRLLYFQEWKLAPLFQGLMRSHRYSSKADALGIMAANYEQKMLVLLPPVRKNESNFWHLTSLSQRAVVGRRHLPADTLPPAPMKGSHWNTSDSHWCALLRNKCFDWFPELLLLLSLKEESWSGPFRRRFGTFFPTCFDHDSNGLAERQ